MSQKNFCPWCGHGTVGCPAFGKCLSDSVKRELSRYVRDNGRNWRTKLCLEWANGSTVLRQVRNTVGPHRLAKINQRQFDLPSNCSDCGRSMAEVGGGTCQTCR